ncbi:MAG: elongation factor P [Actinomycetota bacterium]|jgi:elongation factor P|nr:elongation factor P [Actinomycetota bacterium]
MINTSNFKNGMTIVYDSELYKILYFQHVKPGKGGAFVRTKLKDLSTGTIIEKTFRAGEKMEQAILETKRMQYLYKDQHYNFMDTGTYEQIQLSEKILEDQKDYLMENMELAVIFYKGKPISIDLPITIETRVVKTEPGIKGDTVSSSFKPAVIETGAKVMVPLFINTGDVIKIDTRNGEYLTRIST